MWSFMLKNWLECRDNSGRSIYSAFWVQFACSICFSFLPHCWDTQDKWALSLHLLLRISHILSFCFLTILLSLWAPQLLLHCPFCLASLLLFFAAPLALWAGVDSRRCVCSYVSIYPFLMAPPPPRVGAILCGFRCASDAVGACCHSLLLRARAHDLGSALTEIPGETDMSISPRSHTKNMRKVPNGLNWANLQRLNTNTKNIIYL